ncbi:voltage-dependent calcium channel gamma-6 subunit-like [Protobothrops mucrosquamatus]|uniref:voltage-dependent calcium channel gamma-6 subunit-like n=1 Tax=Protobothrops mucrosquamatus TaxID=103944 RepID=UPI000775CF09|nr:voltage-dependent calcium channel gamma-6 subunit-like [Protobothrops mucrosquamatus]
MMWPNFFLQDREQRIAVRRRGETPRQKVLADEQEGKIKLAFFVAIVGMTLMVLAVGTEFWVELNTYKQNHSAICEAAHFGLWKFCYKKLWVYDVAEERDTCGPAELPGEANCSYFKFFTTGENANIFLRTTKKGLMVLVTLEIFRQSVQWLITSNETIPLEYEYSWSVACAVSAGAILIFGGACFILLSIPGLPKKPWEYCIRKRNTSEHTS